MAPGKKQKTGGDTSRTHATSRPHSAQPANAPNELGREVRRLSRSIVLGARKPQKESPEQVKNIRDWKIALDDKDFSHLSWWKKKLEVCKKPSTVQLVKRLVYSNLLGLDVNLKHGSLKEGTLNRDILQFKSSFPREVLLCRVGDSYEAIGIDACILVEYAGLNPCGGLRSDSVPKAGCPVVYLQQALDDLTRSGYSVCVVRSSGSSSSSCPKRPFYIWACTSG